jgi:hypothetical protein
MQPCREERSPLARFAPLGMPMLGASAPWTIFHHDNNELTGILERRRKNFVNLELCR